MLKWRIYFAHNSNQCLCDHVKYPIFLSDCSQIWYVWTDFHKSPQYESSFTEIRLVGASPMHATGRADMTRVIGAFRDYANALKT